METKALWKIDSKSICAIIETASKHGVKKLKVSDLEVEFSSTQEATAYSPIDAASYFESQGQGDSPKARDFSAQQANELPQPMSLQTVDEVLRDDIRQAQLMVTDPAAYELEMINSQLQD